jgi:GT2 family glycosyltransferase
MSTTAPHDDPAHDDAAFDPASATIAIVTYNRSGLLTRLLESITRMNPTPAHVVIIDNASVDDTTEVVESFRGRMSAEIVYRRLDTNTGGSGGFSEGMRVAYELGSAWMWLMDDDVEVIPDGLARMGKWAPRFKSIQGRRYDYDGSEFYWQYRIAEPLGIPIPFAPAGFDESNFKEMNSGCFEGMFIHRDVVKQIGLPDPRFFIYWDDQLYGWLASRKTTSVIVNEFVLRRTREIKQWDMGIRHMNASSNAYRYYIMRNRAHIKRYYRALGVYNPVLFSAGTTLTFFKEIIRLFFVERTVRGTSNLFRGLRDGGQIARDSSWRPMPPLETVPADDRHDAPIPDHNQ